MENYRGKFWSTVGGSNSLILILQTSVFSFHQRCIISSFCLFSCLGKPSIFGNLARPRGFEPPTSAFAGLRSNSTELRTHIKLWPPRQDSNLRPLRSKRTTLIPLSYEGKIVLLFWQGVWESNPPLHCFKDSRLTNRPTPSIFGFWLSGKDSNLHDQFQRLTA